MTKIMLKKSFGHLVPANECDMVAFNKLKMDSVGEWEMVKPNKRNSKFSEKFHVMMHIAYEAWEPSVVTHKDEIAQKDYDTFRRDIAILVGHRKGPLVNMRNEVRYEAKSISFNNMNQEKFEKFYNKCCNYVLTKILYNYTRDDLDRVVQVKLKEAADRLIAF